MLLPGSQGATLTLTADASGRVTPVLPFWITTGPQLIDFMHTMETIEVVPAK